MLIVGHVRHQQRKRVSVEIYLRLTKYYALMRFIQLHIISEQMKTKGRNIF